MTVKLLTEHNFEFLSLKGGCAGPHESTHVKIPHCWKAHFADHLRLSFNIGEASLKDVHSNTCIRTCTAP